VLWWAAQAVAPGARVRYVAGLREGANPWLLRLEHAGQAYRVILKTGDPASGRDRRQLSTQVAALPLAGSNRDAVRQTSSRTSWVTSSD